MYPNNFRGRARRGYHGKRVGSDPSQWTRTWLGGPPLRCCRCLRPRPSCSTSTGTTPSTPASTPTAWTPEGPAEPPPPLVPSGVPGGEGGSEMCSLPPSQAAVGFGSSKLPGGARVNGTHFF